MRKLFAIMAIAISLTASAQKTDTTKKHPIVDTVFVFSPADIMALQSIIMESSISIQGKPASGKDLNDLMTWIFKHGITVPREQPKK